MFVIWFKSGSEWHWVEVFMLETANIVREALLAKGYEVSKGAADPRKKSLIQEE